MIPYQYGFNVKGMNRTSTDTPVSQVQAESLYTQALDAQERLIRRGEIARHTAHQVVNDSYATVVGTVWIHCTCGDWTEHPEDESQLGYALHLANSLGLKVRMGRAA